MKKIIAFAGSSSSTSINKQLATYAAGLVTNVEVEVLDLNDYDLPLYGIDLENKLGIPKDANRFLDKIKSTDGIVLSLAEHNGTYATVFKNLFDWMSRIDGKLWSDKPMLLMSTSPGPRAGTTGLEIAFNRFQFMGGNIVGKFSLPSFGDNFKDRKITDEVFNNELLEEVKQLEESL
ncbi:MAG: NAD(P)H-dependent oxidoreductase [Winogradskyella sp.]|uniref:NADPH-dependent FMN reductase n=1 Tax=Winogradskyella sp. TaxID=1883156 RepID=UPI001817FA4F|nr:NAD(P)H-dependent oxidoreductase [Winogradskyella sp.]MBT8245188.1 NAD(P)H-dependent oxidoreductase [Winogradskyella sp.]NNK22637.1 NAD(P)H-dependent oxidoreductase [Winogradskyella sp.]